MAQKKSNQWIDRIKNEANRTMCQLICDTEDRIKWRQTVKYRQERQQLSTLKKGADVGNNMILH